ncbi:hypothetical protein PVMG_04546 [Plasmodium vivax Mauritania I]|uniref:Variable surface protein n=1 Tax=Plasmodium vivax Mauritania I TaxID=1035515 RepID=A0A0J9T3Y1_PLAVI|nr:hypothetical protein PVMG_04546 [Plasmodium vivax Mauritania I]
MTNVGHNQEDRCSNLTYWTYDILMNTFNTNKNDNIDNNIISELNNAIFRVNQELKKDKNCTYYIDGTFSEWTEEKYLHDYFENYSTFIQNISDKEKKEIYCQYIDYISKLYKKYMKLCCTCYSRPEYVCVEHCPKFFKCNKQYFPIDLLHKLECNDNVSLKKEKENFESLIVDLEVIRKSQLMAMNFYKILTQDSFYRFIFSTFLLLGIFLIFFLFYKNNSLISIKILIISLKRHIFKKNYLPIRLQHEYILAYMYIQIITGNVQELFIKNDN